MISYLNVYKLYLKCPFCTNVLSADTATNPQQYQ